jgi:hypothetical protein
MITHLNGVGMIHFKPKITNHSELAYRLSSHVKKGVIAIFTYPSPHYCVEREDVVNAVCYYL